jgi:prepilin-type N-terminal cleavage/methylation domain-containing protein/prepilin-type processing-associated H-X9-DG protein
MSAPRNPHRCLSHRGNVCLGGFTLIELLVVIAIIAVLAALAFPLWGRMRASSMAATCTANLRTLHQATMHFAADNNGFFPVAESGSNNYVFALGGTSVFFPTPGYVGLSGNTVEQRSTSLRNLGLRRAPFCFWCPATEEAQPRKNGNTYSMNLYIGGSSADRSIPTLRTFQVTTPAKTALYMDGCVYAGDRYGVFVGRSDAMPSPVHPPAIFKETNNPARSVNVVFVDGHVEMRRIGDIPTDFSDPFWDGTK